jgi:mono/diheme cytochrome c family protein
MQMINRKYCWYALKNIMVALFGLYFISCHSTPYMQGKRLYAIHCSNCHMDDGSGLSALIPALNSSKYLGSSDIACVLYSGIRDTIFDDTTYLLREMPSFKAMSTTEITNIVNFVNHSWAPEFKESSILDIQKSLKNCQQ